MFMGRVTKQNRKMQAVEGAHKAELLGEKTVRYAVSRSSRRLQESLHTERQAEKTAEAGRLQFEAMKKSGKEVGKHAAEVEQSKKNAILRFWQKRRYKQAYAAAKEGKKATEDTIRVTETIAVKAKKVLQEILCQEPGNFRRYRCLRIVVRSDGSLTQQLQRQHSGRQYHNYFYHLCQRG